MNAAANAKTNLPNLKNHSRMHVHLSGNHFQQNVVGIPNKGNVINIYCVYKLDPIASSRDTSFTIQDTLTVSSYHVTYAFQSESTLYRPVWLNG